jgi:hypothetical protein
MTWSSSAGESWIHAVVSILRVCVVLCACNQPISRVRSRRSVYFCFDRDSFDFVFLFGFLMRRWCFLCLGATPLPRRPYCNCGHSGLILFF